MLISWQSRAMSNPSQTCWMKSHLVWKGEVVRFVVKVLLSCVLHFTEWNILVNLVLLRKKLYEVFQSILLVFETGQLKLHLRNNGFGILIWILCGETCREGNVLCSLHLSIFNLGLIIIESIQMNVIAKVVICILKMSTNCYGKYELMIHSDL